MYHILLNPIFVWIVSRAFPGLGHDAHFLALAGVAAIGTLAVASLSFYGFEAPILRLKESPTRIAQQTEGRPVAIKTEA